MDIGVFVQALRVLHVARERIEPVEASVDWVVEAGSQVLLLCLGVEVLAGVTERGCRSGRIYGARRTMH